MENNLIENISTKSSTFYYSYEGVNIELDSRGIARITNDANLKSFILRIGHNSRELANNIKTTFRSKWGYDLNITTDSLTVEILGHYYPDKVLNYIQVGTIGAGLPGVLISKAISYLKIIISPRVAVIDCGIKEVDSNRDIWDGLSSWRSKLESLLVD